MEKIQELKIKKEKDRLEYNLKKKELNILIKNEEYVRRINYRKKHKKIFLTLDIIVIVIILSNFGALIITNMLVTKEITEDNPEAEILFLEANPVTAEIYELKTSLVVNISMIQAFVFVFVWTILTFIYILARNSVPTYLNIYHIVFYMMFYFFALVTDFINNLGFLIGARFYG